MDVRVISWFYESQIYFEGYLWFMGVSYHVSLISFRSGGATVRRYNEAALMQVINFEKDFLTYLKVFKHLCLDSTLQSRVANLRYKTELTDYDVVIRIKNTKKLFLGSSQGILETNIPSIPVWHQKYVPKKFMSQKTYESIIVLKIYFCASAILCHRGNI